MGILLIIVLGLYAIAVDIRWIGASMMMCKISGLEKRKLPRGAFFMLFGEFLKKTQHNFSAIHFNFPAYQAILLLISFTK